MKIAVASQNRKTITGHAGKCRKFWIYDTADTAVTSKTLLELPVEQSFHESHGRSHPLDEIDVLICGGFGQGLMNRLKSKNIEGLITMESDPDTAVSAYLTGNLETCATEHHEHAHLPHSLLSPELPIKN